MASFTEAARTLIARLTVCEDEAMVDDLIQDLAAAGDGVKILSFVNAHAVMRSTREPEFFNFLIHSDWLLRDGSGMAMLMRRMGGNPGLNLNGTDLIPRLLESVAKDHKIALLGTREPRLGLAANRLRAMGFEHITMVDGFQPDQAYIDHVRREDPHLVILAMGMPKQERIAHGLAADPQVAASQRLLINGGAILDFLSGEVNRAPYWMRRIGIEWLYRLLREPRRMYPRFRDSVSFALLTRLHAATIGTQLAQQPEGRKS